MLLNFVGRSSSTLFGNASLLASYIASYWLASRNLTGYNFLFQISKEVTVT